MAAADAASDSGSLGDDDDGDGDALESVGLLHNASFKFICVLSIIIFLY